MKISLKNITQGGKPCKNPTITWDVPEQVDLPCKQKDDDSIEVEFPDGYNCIDVIIDCDDCDQCPPVRKTICVCESDKDCSKCETCHSEGFCVEKPCDGFCNEETGGCQECRDNKDCFGQKECFNGKCQCPPGTFEEGDLCLECVDGEIDGCKICAGGYWEDLDCGDNYICIPGEGCVEICDCENPSCTDPQKSCTPFSDPNFPDVKCVCLGCNESACENNDDCGRFCHCVDKKCVKDPCAETKCDDYTDCPFNCGCGDDGYCHSCASADCETDECGNLAGCGCVGENCEDTKYLCNPEDICLEWKLTPADGGVITDSQPPLTYTSVVSYIGEYTNSSGVNYANYSFQVNVNETGSWFYYNGNQEVAIGSSVTLQELQDNLGFFELRFKETGGCGRTLRLPYVQNTTQDNPLLSEDEGWILYTQGVVNRGCSTSTGGTPPKLELCVCGPTEHVILPSSVQGTTDNTLNINLQGSADSCVTAVASGCGTFNGTVAVECGGVVTTVDLPEYSVDTDCCDPYDPNCVNSGEPCTDVTAENLPLQVDVHGQTGQLTNAEATAYVDVLALFH